MAEHEGTEAYRESERSRIVRLRSRGSRPAPREPRDSETAVRESEARLKTMFQAARVGIGLVSNRVLLDANDRLCELVGYRREELIGQNARMLYPTQEDYDYVGRTKYEQIRERGVGAVETRWQRKNGEVIDVVLNSIPLDAGDLSKGVTFSVLDITERKQTEDALGENRAKLQTILDSSPCGIAVFDLESRIVDANAAGLNVFGLRSRDQAIGRSLFDFVSPLHWDRVRDHTARTLRDGLVQNVEYTLLTKDGHEFIGEVSSSVIRDVSGNPCGLVMVANDITERKWSENLMRIQHDLAVSLGAVGDLDEGLRLCLQAALHASGLDCGGIYLRDEPSGGLDMPCHTGLSDDFVARVSHFDREAVNTRLVMGGRPIYVTYEKLGVPLDETALREGLRAIAVIPIIHRGQVIGCLNVASRSLAEVPPYSRGVLETIASQIGGTIARLTAEEEVRHERELRDRIADTSPAGITVVDREGRLTFANPRAEEILGLTREQITRRTYNAPAWHITDYDGGPFPEEQLPFRRVMITGQPVHDVRHAIEWPDGRRILLSINAAPLLGKASQIEGVVTTIEDVTEKVHAEQALQTSERRFRAIIERSGDIFALVDAQGNSLYDSPSVRHWFGYDEHENLGRNIHEFVHPDDWLGVKTRFERLVMDGGVTTAELRLRHKDGSWRWIEATATNLLADPHVGAVTISYHEITSRKQAEEALRDSEKMFSAVVGQAKDGIVLFQGRGLILVNQALADMVGYSREELLARPFTDFVAPESRALIAERVESRLRGETPPSTYEATLLRRDGRIVHVELTAAVIQLGGKPTDIGVIRNIADRKQAEAALRESEERFRATFEQAAVGVAHVGLDGRWLRVNQRLCDIVGYTPDELLARTFQDITHPDDLHADLALTCQVLTGEIKTYSMEKRYIRKQGSCVWINLTVSLVREPSGKPQYFIGVMEDITVRKQAEEALRESEQRYREVFESTSDAIFLLDVNADGRFTYSGWNPREEKDLGIAAAEALGRHPEDFLPGAVAEAVNANCRRCVEAGTAISYEESLGLPNGRLYAHTTLVPVRDDTGQIRRIFGFGHNITERKRAEEELLAHERQLRVLASELSLAEERERKRIAGELHDHTCQSLVLARMKLDELLSTLSAPQAEAFRGISDTLNETIQGVRELTFDLSSPTLYKFGLEAALEELLDDKLRSYEGSDYSFSDDHQPKPLTEDVRVLLFQCVREVLVNIVKHAQAHNVSLDMGRTDHSIKITVADDGVGFDVDEVLSLPARHRGFGLFNIKERLDYVGGILEINSRRGEGSQVVLVAPLKMEEGTSRRNHNVGEDSAC